MRLRNSVIVWAGVVVIILLTYLSVWEPAFWIFNDRSLANPQIPSVISQRVLARATWAFSTTATEVRVINLLFHLCNTALVALVLRRLCSNLLIVAVVTLLWATNIVNVEAIAYAAGRSDLLAMTGVLIATLAAVSDDISWEWWALVGACIGLASKEVAIVVLAVIPLVRYATHQSWEGEALICATMAVMAIWAFGGPTAIIEMELHSQHVSMLDWFMIQSVAVFRLIGVALLVAVPTIDYDYDLVSAVVRGISAVSLIAAFIFTTHQLRQGKRWALGAMWLMVTILPRLFVQTPRSYLNEHQFYISSVGLAMLVVYQFGGHSAEEIK